ncbi:MAG TPA: BamA/TamA family outer membrane protein, partial [Thermoanaerobaculia bacterium]|nr:BamA/TamA family outer membrane protein [Thermoanaerobaculia bacterium]
QASDLLQKAEVRADPRGEATPAPDPTNFASYNIYSLDLANGDLLQFTDVVGGTFTPVVYMGENNKERMVFASYYKQQWRLFSTPTDRPLHAAEKTSIPSAPLQAESRTAFQPPVEVAIDPEKIEPARNHKLFIDDVEVNAGVSSDQLFVSRSVIYMSDMLGDRRFVAALDSVSSFSNFDFLYFDLHKRLNWGVRLFDNRSFFTVPDQETGRSERIKQDYRQTGVMGILSYPFTRYHRLDFGGGYESRQIAYPFLRPVGGDPNNLELFFVERKDNFPVISTSFSGDTTQFREFGPIAGRRYELGYQYAPDLKRHGTLTSDLSLDFRQYMQLTSRTLLAARVYTAYSTGNFPNFYYFGGLNTVRGYPFRSIIGSTAGFANLEFRFPLIDFIATPVLNFSGVRGNLFFDVGAAKFQGQPFKFSEAGKLKDGIASIGYGFSFDFMGLELHWDFARRFDGRHTIGKSRTEFWIGQTF